MDNEEINIGESLKRFRQEFNLTAGSAADAIGIIQQLWYKYESGKVAPSAKVIYKIATAYNVSADYLLGLSDNPRPPDTSTLVAAINDAHKILGDALDTRPQ